MIAFCCCCEVYCIWSWRTAVSMPNYQRSNISRSISVKESCFTLLAQTLTVGWDAGKSLWSHVYRRNIFTHYTTTKYLPRNSFLSFYSHMIFIPKKYTDASVTIHRQTFQLPILATNPPKRVCVCLGLWVACYTPSRRRGLKESIAICFVFVDPSRFWQLLWWNVLGIQMYGLVYLMKNHPKLTVGRTDQPLHGPTGAWEIHVARGLETTAFTWTWNEQQKT